MFHNINGMKIKVLDIWFLLLIIFVLYKVATKTEQLLHKEIR